MRCLITVCTGIRTYLRIECIRGCASNEQAGPIRQPVIRYVGRHSLGRLSKGGAVATILGGAEVFVLLLMLSIAVSLVAYRLRFPYTLALVLLIFLPALLF